MALKQPPPPEPTTMTSSSSSHAAGTGSGGMGCRRASNWAFFWATSGLASGVADSLARAVGTVPPAGAPPAASVPVAASAPPPASAAVVRNCRLLTSAAIPSSDRSGLVGTRVPGAPGLWGAEPTGRRGVRGAWAPCEHGTARAPASWWAIWVELAGLAPGWRGLCRRGVWAALPDIGPLRLGAPYSSRSLPTPRPMPWPCPPP